MTSVIGKRESAFGVTIVCHSVRVMIANRSAVIRELVLETLLDLEGFEPFLVAHVQDVIAQLGNVKPHVVVLGSDMAVMNDFETIREIRACDPQLPIILLCLSAEARLKAINEAFPAEANDHATFNVLMGHVASAKQHLHEELVPKLRFWSDQYRDQTESNESELAAHSGVMNGPIDFDSSV